MEPELTSIPLVITGYHAWTAAGDGLDVLGDLLDRRGHAFHRPPPYPAEGLTRPLGAFVEDLERDRPAETLLLHAVRQALADARLDPASSRVGLVAGTSTGNVSGPWERWHRAVVEGREPGPEDGCGRDGPTVHVARILGLSGPRATLSVACASGTAAFLLASAWLWEGRADAVVVAGSDALSLYIHAGFNGLGALSATGARPFHPERDGLTPGEAAGAVVLEPEVTARRRNVAWKARFLGVAASGDATHISAPHREGRGVVDALRAALAEAGRGADAVDLLSVHGTGTSFNDAMEAQAFSRVFGGRPLRFHGVKHAIGHTMGAAGAVEAAVVVRALAEGWIPPGPAEIAPDLPLALDVGREAPRLAVSTSSAFGGSNGALVLGARGEAPAPVRLARPGAPREVARVCLDLPPGRPDLATLWPGAPERVARMNRYPLAGLLAFRALLAEAGAMPGPDTALAMASGTNCRSVDLRYHRRLVERGAGGASRVDFVHTIPGAPIAEVSILWGWRGPGLALVGTGDEALDEAARLLRWGRAPRVLVLAMESPADDAPLRAEARWLE